MQDRSVRRHRLDRVDDVGQHLVVHLDEVEGPVRGGMVDGRDGRDRVPVVERLPVREDVLGHVPVVDHGLAGRLEPPGKAGKVGARQHRLDPRQGFRLRRVDGADPGVGVRAPQDLADQHVRKGEVRAEAGPSGDLVDPVRPYRPGAYPPEVLAVARHPRGSFSSWRARGPRAARFGLDGPSGRYYCTRGLPRIRRRHCGRGAVRGPAGVRERADRGAGNGRPVRRTGAGIREFDAGSTPREEET